MTKISADELFRNIGILESFIDSERDKSIRDNPSHIDMYINRFDERMDTLYQVKLIIKQMADFQGKKCKKCGNIHSHVIDCSDRMTFNVNNHTYVDERIYYCNKCSEMHVSNLPNPHFSIR